MLPNNLMQIMNMMRMGQNPNLLIQQFANQDPRVQMMLNQFRNSGMSPQQFVYQYAKQNGIDMSQIEAMMGNNRGNRY